MKRNNSNSLNDIKDKKENHTLRNIFIFIVFLILGIVLGIYGTTKYLESKNINDTTEEENKNDLPEDITKDTQMKDLIQNIYSIINGNVMFYTTKGIQANTLDNTSKLLLIYNYLNAKNEGTPLKLDILAEGSGCSNGFIVDETSNPLETVTTCSVIQFNRNLFEEANNKLFNDELLDTSVSFSPANGKNCVLGGKDNFSYICGNILNQSGYTGALESKFTIQKVTKDNDGTIEIYEKGYLIDKRSNVSKPDDGYDNYYLHSTDSTDYYYELKNAENLTFKHTFKTTDRLNYYYVSSELVS